MQPLYDIESKERRDYKTSLNEIKTLLSLAFDNNRPKEQLVLEEVYNYVYERIGIIQDANNKNEVEELKALINKYMEFDYETFFNLIIELSNNCCVEDSPTCGDCPIRNYCEQYRTKKVMEQKNSDNPLLIDLFSGAGGMSLGFKHAGFNIALANDVEKCCIDTYTHNHPEVPIESVVLDDIKNLLTYAEQLLPNKEIDLIIGGPPCQGFSNANRQRLIDDPRNKLYKHFVEFVNLIKPNFFVMENVRGMQSISDQIIEDFEQLGYNVHCEILNAADFGVPQNRERIIFIGNLIGVDSKQIFSEIRQKAKEIDTHVLKDALYGLRELKASTIKNSTELDTEKSGRKIDKNNYYGKENEYINLINNSKKSKFVFNHKARYNNDRDIEIFGRLNQGDKSDDPKIADIMPYKNRNHIFKDKYFKLQNDKFSKTITAHMKFDCNMYIHPTQARGLTPREAARVQSFPDIYFFKGPYTKTYMQVGNSVPPLMGRGIAKVIKEYIDKFKEDKSLNEKSSVGV
ncbi:DNA cytosine methyltransferase [Oceanobacillus halotolerans]|uniref:DNA cytosine methyltransferase n=1 Tax=Oceanobacillus halotolerans TaxID=2663380 RepID=UPI001969B8FD|nr:DNA cytosine methyltransferase [Oceanobacillus halotolerans]